MDDSNLPKGYKLGAIVVLSCGVAGFTGLAFFMIAKSIIYNM